MMYNKSGYQKSAAGDYLENSQVIAELCRSRKITNTLAPNRTRLQIPVEQPDVFAVIAEVVHVLCKLNVFGAGAFS